MEAVRTAPASPSRVNVRALRAGIGPILSMVEDSGYQVIITRKGKDVARLSPVKKIRKKQEEKCASK